MKIIPAKKEEVLSLYKKYYDELKYGIDGYYERTMLEGDNFLIIGEEVMGIYSVYEERGITGFYVLEKFKERYEEILSYVLDNTTETLLFMTNKDKLLLSEIDRRGYDCEIQSYNFFVKENITTEFTMTLANIDEVDEIEKIFGDFAKNYQEKITKKELYVKKDKLDKYICLGFYEPLTLDPNKACVAMKIVEDERKKGYGYKTVQFIIQTLQDKNITPNARCWVKNHASKKTLEKSGFINSNEVLIVHLDKQRSKL